jgi:integrase
MNKQKGFAFLPFLLANWQLIAIGLLVLTVFGYYKHCESVKEAYSTFVEKTRLAGEEQQRITKETIARNQKEKERSDAENKRLRDANLSLSRSLRESRSSRQYLPAPSPSAKRPDAATFDRGELERAIQSLDESVSRIIAEGDQARIDLDSARTWAQGR